MHDKQAHAGGGSPSPRRGEPYAGASPTPRFSSIASASARTGSGWRSHAKHRDDGETAARQAHAALNRRLAPKVRASAASQDHGRKDRQAEDDARRRTRQDEAGDEGALVQRSPGAAAQLVGQMMSTSEGGMICASVPETVIAPVAIRRSYP